MGPLPHIISAADSWRGLPMGLIGSLGTTEILIILAIALMVLGPAKLPEVAKKLGKGLRELRRATDDLRDGFYDDVRDIRSTLKDTEREVRKAAKGDETPPPGTTTTGTAATKAGEAPVGDPPSAPAAPSPDAPSATVLPTARPAAETVPVERTSSRPGGAPPGTATADPADWPLSERPPDVTGPAPTDESDGTEPNER